MASSRSSSQVSSPAPIAPPSPLLLSISPSRSPTPSLETTARVWSAALGLLFAWL